MLTAHAELGQQPACATSSPDGEHGEPPSRGDRQGELQQSGQASAEGALPRLVQVEGRRDGPQAGLAADGHHHGAARSPTTTSLPSRTMRASGGPSLDVLGDRHRLARQRRLVHFQAVGGQQAGVGGTRSPGCQQQDVARHDLRRRHDRGSAVAQHAGGGGAQLPHRLGRPAGLALLPGADGRC